ncbi:MAG: hypothetical protein ACFHWX_16980 [Bacteroidota bacterium]
MEAILHWKHLKINLIFLIALNLPNASFSQGWEIIDSLVVPYKISSYAIDQEGKVYLGSLQGDLYRYDNNWNEDKVFSGINYSAVTTVEPWNRLKLFLFYRENQSIVFMNRFILTPTELHLSALNIGFGNLATIGVDNSYWILESNFSELRKYSNKELLFATPLGQIDLEHASHMRAYQNLLILLDKKKGFYLFDQFGNKLSERSLEGASYFHIANKLIVTYDGNDVIEFNPFFHSEAKKIKGPLRPFKGVIKSGEEYLFIDDQRILKYRLK